MPWLAEDDFDYLANTTTVFALPAAGCLLFSFFSLSSFLFLVRRIVICVLKSTNVVASHCCYYCYCYCYSYYSRAGNTTKDAGCQVDAEGPSEHLGIASGGRCPGVFGEHWICL